LAVYVLDIRHNAQLSANISCIYLMH